MSDEYRPDRREFLKDMFRKLALGVLVCGTGALVAKPGRQNENCTSDGICSRCRELPGCGLPQALSARRHR